MIPIGEAPDKDATAGLWNDLSKPLLAYLRARTRTDADAADLLQEVFFRVHRQLSTLRKPEKLQGWVYRIARNAVIDHYRSRRESTPLNAELLADDSSAKEVVDLAPTLRRFVANLPLPYREPLELHEFDGKPLQDVAKKLGLTLTATKSRVRRGRLLLRKMLDDCCRFEFDRRGRVIDATPWSLCKCDEC